MVIGAVQGDIGEVDAADQGLHRLPRVVGPLQHRRIPAEHLRQVVQHQDPILVADGGIVDLPDQTQELSLFRHGAPS